MLSGSVALVLLLFASQFKHSVQESWWLSDTEFIYYVDHAGADVYNVITRNTSNVLFSTSNEFSSILHSRDLRYTSEKMQLHDTALYPNQGQVSMSIHDNSNGMSYPIGPSSGYEIQYFQWSHGSAYACRYDSDIYYAASPGEPLIRVTERGGSMWFSPSDKYLAHTSGSGGSSNTVTMTAYNRADQYDYQYPIGYTMPGESPKDDWTYSIWSVEDKKSIELNFPSRANSSVNEHASTSWVVLHGKELLVVVWSNRWRNETAITLCSYENGTCSLLYEHKYEHAQWCMVDDYSSMVHSDSAIFFILPEATEDNAWQHIVKMEISTDLRLESISYLPSGEYDIRKILAYRPIEQIVVYDAQAPHRWNRHVYATPAGTGSVLQADQCISCVSANCTFQENLAVSGGKDLNIGLSCNGPLPNYKTVIALNSTLHPTELHNITEPDTTVDHPKWNIETFTLSSGYEAIVRISEGDAKLSSVAVTLMVYGGPEDNEVLDDFKQLPVPKGHAAVYIDVRGSGGRGWKYRGATYGRLLSVEVEDTIEAMKMVLAKYPRLDKNRVGVYGWSYGGSMTTALVERAPQGFFKCAVAGAGVMNFYNYAAWYADRYMGDAPRSAYVDLTQNVTAFEHTKLLLVHGMRDDNVLFRHSALLIEALQEADIPFELMVYPNQDHGLTGNAADHWYHLFASFLTTCYE